MNNVLEKMFGMVNGSLPNFLSRSITSQYFRINTFMKLGSRGHHSSQVEYNPKVPQMARVKILPALTDNYMFLIIDDSSKHAVVVDPVVPETIISAIQEESVQLLCILTTHHHWDHSGGNKKLLELLSEKCSNNDEPIDVYGGDDKRVEGLTKPVKHNDLIDLGGCLKFKCLSTPCHTKDHICYLMEGVADPNPTPPYLFSGDTLFLGGCGRFFEGNAEQMNQNLNTTLASLPDETRIFCGHEYSVSNLKFADKVLPNNQFVKDKLKWCEERRMSKMPTIPSTISEEKRYNPFMKVSDESLRLLTNTSHDVSTMKALRSLKDNF